MYQRNRLGDILKYRIPGKETKVLSGNFVELNGSDSYNGFFISNFDQSVKYGFIESDKEEEIHFKNTLPITISHDEYIHLAQKLIGMMQNGECDKIVISRVAKYPLQMDLNLVFDKLVENYPKAFVYFVSSPFFGTWIGASPEVLLKFQNDHYEIASLAGTKLADDDSAWGYKEIIEQKLVTEFIERKLKELTISEYNVSATKDAIAGPVKHLKTTFSINELFDVSRLISEIHPTPAVSGLPREKALPVIKSSEKHQRELYAGIIGELSEQSSLYVNLRCMQCTQDSAYLYLGGGLTALSNPEKEWEETKNKAKTLLRVIE